MHRPSLGDPLRDTRGQSVVEFALIVPVLMLMLLITVDFGRLFMSYVTLNNVTRVAANFGALDPGSFTGTPNTTTYNAVVTRESAGLNCTLRADGGGHNPPIPTFPGGSQLGGTSAATMTCDFRLLTPFIGGFFGGQLPISSTAQFPIRTGAIANIGGSTTLPPPGSPVADFTFTGVSGGTVDGSGNVTGNPPTTVNVLDGSTNAQTWQWQWGDGSPDEFVQVPAPHQFNGASSYTVTLTVTNPQGSSSRSRTVSLASLPTPPPVAGFYGTPVGTAPQVTGGGSSGAVIQAVRNTRVDFTNISSGASAYSWAFGDGQTSTQSDPQHQYSSLGIYTVVMTITTPPAGGSFTRSNYVQIGCVGPNFAGTMTNAAAGTWSGADFTGTIYYQPSTANGNSNRSTTPPATPKNIVAQDGVNGGLWVPPTKPNGNAAWCGTDITLKYTP